MGVYEGGVHILAVVLLISYVAILGRTLCKYISFLGFMEVLPKNAKGGDNSVFGVGN